MFNICYPVYETYNYYKVLLMTDWQLKILHHLYFAYCRIRRYFWESNFTKKHLTFGVVDGKLQITSIEHGDFIQAVQQKIDKLVQKEKGDFVKSGLRESLEGCNFIIFSPVNNDNTFIQFWTAENKLKFNFYANKTNKLKKYYLSVIGLLSETGFVNNQIEKYSGSMVYKVDKGKDYISVDANFGKDVEKASKFTEIIFKDIYKIGSQKLRAKVE